MGWKQRHIVQACPFCGSWISLVGGEEYEGHVWTAVECYTCSTTGPSINGYNETRATEAWNVRGGPPELLSFKNRGYARDGKKDPTDEVLGHKACPFCDSRKVELMEDWIFCTNCGTNGPAHLERMNEKETVTATPEQLAWGYWNERALPFGKPGEKSWTYKYSRGTIEGVLEAIEDKNGLTFIRIREENGHGVHILAGDLPCDLDFCREFMGWEVRFRTTFEPLEKPRVSKKSSKV